MVSSTDCNHGYPHIVREMNLGDFLSPSLIDIEASKIHCSTE